MNAEAGLDVIVLEYIFLTQISKRNNIFVQIIILIFRIYTLAIVDSSIGSKIFVIINISSIYDHGKICPANDSVNISFSLL